MQLVNMIKVKLADNIFLVSLEQFTLAKLQNKKIS